MDSKLIKKISEDSARWVDEGIITQDARERIIERYRKQGELEQKAGPGKLISTLSVMGAVLVGVGVVLFVSSNWKEMARWSKFCVLFFPMLACYAAGWWLRHGRANFPKVGAALMLLGSIIYGAAIFLVAQMFNISVHYPNGILMWWAAILPLAYLTGLVPILVLSLGCMLTWLGTEASFWIYEYEPFSYVGLYMMAGLLLWKVGTLHERVDGKVSESFVKVYLALGLVVVCITFFICTNDDFLDIYTFNKSVGEPLRPVVFLLAIAAPVACIAAWNLARGARGATYKVEAAVVIALLALAGYLGYSFTGSSKLNLDYYYVGANVLYLLFIITLIVIGYYRRMPVYFNVGLLFFVVLVTARYFDMFWDLMPRSVFFMAGGVLMITGGVILERQRRRVIASFGGGAL